MPRKSTGMSTARKAAQLKNLRLITLMRLEFIPLVNKRDQKDKKTKMAGMASHTMEAKLTGVRATRTSNMSLTQRNLHLSQVTVSHLKVLTRLNWEDTSRSELRVKVTHPLEP